MSRLGPPARRAGAHAPEHRKPAHNARICACAAVAGMMLACGAGAPPAGRRSASGQDPVAIDLHIAILQEDRAPGTASPPALIYDRRWLELDAGEVTVTFSPLTLPTEVVWLAAQPEITWLTHQLEPALQPGLAVDVVIASGIVTGTLLGVTDHVIVLAPDYPDGTARWFRRADVRALRAAGGKVSIMRALGATEAPVPAMRARARVARAGEHLVELAYRAVGFSWSIGYQLQVTVDQAGEAALEQLSSIAYIRGLESVRARSAMVELWSPPGHSWSAAPVWRGRFDAWSYAASGFTAVVHDYPGRASREPGRIPARIEHVYSGALPISRTASVEELAAADAGRSSRSVLTRELVIPGELTRTLVAFPPGPAEVRIAPHAGAIEELTARIPGSAPGEDLRVPLGPSQDITGQRIQRLVERQGNRIRERYDVVLVSRAAVPVTVRVIEPLIRPGQVTMLYANPSPIVRTASELELLVSVPPGQQATATYELEYAW